MTPTVLITGLQGSGRTDFIKEILPDLNQAGWSPVVILNDFEMAQAKAESIDEKLARVIPIERTCIGREGLESFMELIPTIPKSPDTIMIVHANETAESLELLDPLTIEARKQGLLPPIQVAVVDAMRWQRRQEANQLEGMQVITAPYLVLNRLNELKKARRSKVETAITSINPFAEQTTAKEFAQTLNALKPVKDSEEVFTSNAESFSSLAIDLAAPLDRNALESFLQNLPREIIRAKGIAVFEEAPDRAFLFQKIDGIKEIDYLPLEEGAPASSLVSLIGPSMPVANVIETAEKLDITSQQTA